MNGATTKALMDGSAYLLKTLNGKYVVVPRNVLGMNYMFRVEQAFSQFSRTALNVKSFNRSARYKTNKQFISALEDQTGLSFYSQCRYVFLEEVFEFFLGQHAVYHPVKG